MADDVEPDTATPEVANTPEPIDASVYEAKISELTAVIAERDATIGELNAAMAVTKAHNYDMLMAAKGEELPADVDEVVTDDVAPAIDDFFEKKD